jgi:hypothetical protein
VTTREPQIRETLAAGRASPAGNERLTAMTGAVLLVLFVAECLTLLNIGNLLTLHVFLGMLLLGPVGLKIGSTLWRFTRYYTGSAAYVRRGPPAWGWRSPPITCRVSGAVRAASFRKAACPALAGPVAGWHDECRLFALVRVPVPARVRRVPCGSM